MYIDNLHEAESVHSETLIFAVLFFTCKASSGAFCENLTYFLISLAYICK